MRRFPKTVETVRSQLLKFKKEIWVVVEHNRSIRTQRCYHARNSRQNARVNTRRLIDKIVRRA